MLDSLNVKAFLSKFAPKRAPECKWVVTEYHEVENHQLEAAREIPPVNESKKGEGS